MTPIMKKFIDNPATLADDLLEGYAMAFPKLIEKKDHMIINKKLADADRVTIVAYGGGGHEPALEGFVGEGGLDICIVGDIFAAPAPDAVLEALKLADKGHGTILVTFNHAGDMLTGKMVMADAEDEDLTVRQIITQEDIATGEPRPARMGDVVDRRGLGGGCALFHILGAAAQEGMDLDTIAKLGWDYANSMATLSVAARCATHPANGEPFGDLGDDLMEIGMGQHGEGGGGRKKLAPAKDVAEEMAKALVDDIGLVSGDKVFLMINGSGATTLMEMFIVYRDTVNYLKTLGIEVVDNWVGEILTTQEQAGFQMNIVKWNDTFARLWNAPIRSPYLTK